MATVNIKAAFPYNIQKVWDIVTSLENTAWRSDLSRVEIISENQFVEYTKTDMQQLSQLQMRKCWNAGNLIWKTRKEWNGYSALFAAIRPATEYEKIRS